MFVRREESIDSLEASLSVTGGVPGEIASEVEEDGYSDFIVPIECLLRN